MRSVRLFEIEDCSIDAVMRAKGTSTVSLCIPCRDEAATIGSLVSIIRQELMRRVPFVDELIVLDDRSTDDTASVAASAGATVVPIEQIHAKHGEGHGKGNVLWASLVASHGDFVVWVDGDITSFEPHWITRLLAPMLDDESVALVKAVSHRPTQLGGGGRTTELVARPLMSLYYPELTGLHQPLAGEYAGRRTVLEQLPFVQGWGVEIAMLIDVARRFGPEAIAQIDLGTREHRHRGLHALSVQAAEVMATMLARVPEGSLLHDPTPSLRRPDGSLVPLNLAERPPLAWLSR
ncbi:MAG: glucosyl-3-phosphoglycerate synthase [Pseudomonas sp.]|uniref:glucosyl-3-phosphoglycerate synthase n=1 Tax=Pseudomonas sp. TaxID=306 RepID=UPI0027197C3B|nr:glucosyl-3-phosphoglycerate synthase [Pseudomonas sp.]MDO8403105.1 glucosyl-3-phosphoglycerate synthase [Pseudomonas sp.]